MSFLKTQIELLRNAIHTFKDNAFESIEPLEKQKFDELSPNEKFEAATKLINIFNIVAGDASFRLDSMVRFLENFLSILEKAASLK